MDVPYQKANLNYNELIGRPYKAGGRGPADYDCWGLCMKVAAALGAPLPELPVPEDNDLRAELVRMQRARNFVQIDRPKAGCLALFRVIDDDNKIRWHVGIVLPDLIHFIHITEKMGVNVAGLDRQPWKLFLDGFYCRK